MGRFRHRREEWQPKVCRRLVSGFSKSTIRFFLIAFVLSLGYPLHTIIEELMGFRDSNSLEGKNRMVGPPPECYFGWFFYA